jgi:hypothetical protein
VRFRTIVWTERPSVKNLENKKSIGDLLLENKKIPRANFQMQPKKIKTKPKKISVKPED